jgi:hypothetical protein
MILGLAGLALQVAAAATKPPAVVPAKSLAAAAAEVRPAEELRAMSQRYAPTVRGCYEREGLRRDPALSATLDVTVTIDSLGAVIRARVDTLDVRGEGMSDVAACVQAAASQWRFSSGRFSVEETTFTYKLVPPTPAPRDTTHSYSFARSAFASSTRKSAIFAVTAST